MTQSGETLFNPEVWRPPLETYAVVVHLTVQLYDAAGRPAGEPVHPTPLFDLVARRGPPVGFAECARQCLAQAPGSPGIVVETSHGLAVVGTPLSLPGGVAGAVVAGYGLTDFASTLSIERLARDHGLPFEAVWELARSIPPVRAQQLTLYGELLRVLGEALLKEQGRSRETGRLYGVAQDAARAKDAFLAALSHELRQPMASIVGWINILKTRSPDPDTLARGLDVLERNARAQAQLIDDLLDVSSIVSGKLRLEVGEVDPTAVAAAALEVVRFAAEAKGVRLAADLDSAAGPVSGDPDRLQQVAWNLLSNAVKFTPAGGRVDVRLERVAGSVRITVADTGQGIAPELLPHVFERFTQGPIEAGRPGAGLGLGLAIVKHLVEMHGGTVEAASEGQGRGATFTVTLPLRAVPTLELAESLRKLRRSEGRASDPDIG